MSTFHAVASWFSARSVARDATLIVAFAFLTALSAHAKFFLPGTPVPITMQSFTVLLAGAWLGSYRGAASQILLVAGGALGLPVFATSAHLLGPTGGYFLGFILAAFVMGAFRDRALLKKSAPIVFLITFGASLFIFAPGVVWLSAFTGQSLNVALHLGFWPFLAGDVVKCALLTAVILVSRR